MFVTGVGVALGLSGCRSLAPSHKINPRPASTLFSDAAGGFSVLMPMRPKEIIERQPGTNGPPVEIHEFTVNPRPSLELTVMYNDFPKSLPNVWAIGTPSWFNAVQEGAMKQLGESRLIYATESRFGSHPMREFRFEVLKTRATCQVRCILVGLRMYQLIVVWPVDIDASREAETFFNSFRLLYAEQR